MQKRKPEIPLTVTPLARRSLREHWKANHSNRGSLT